MRILGARAGAESLSQLSILRQARRRGHYSSRDFAKPPYVVTAKFLKVEGKKVCSAELLFMFIPHEQFAAGYRDEVLDAYWEANPPARKVGAGQ